MIPELELGANISSRTNSPGYVHQKLMKATSFLFSNDSKKAKIERFLGEMHHFCQYSRKKMLIIAYFSPLISDAWLELGSVDEATAILGKI